jgi:hypothetical protein
MMHGLHGNCAVPEWSALFTAARTGILKAGRVRWPTFFDDDASGQLNLALASAKNSGDLLSSQ